MINYILPDRLLFHNGIVYSIAVASICNENLFYVWWNFKLSDGYNLGLMTNPVFSTLDLPLPGEKLDSTTAKILMHKIANLCINEIGHVCINCKDKMTSKRFSTNISYRSLVISELLRSIRGVMKLNKFYEVLYETYR